MGLGFGYYCYGIFVGNLGSQPLYHGVFLFFIFFLFLLLWWVALRAGFMGNGMGRRGLDVVQMVILLDRLRQRSFLWMKLTNDDDGTTFGWDEFRAVS